jgi:hypothetical protein
MRPLRYTIGTMSIAVAAFALQIPIAHAATASGPEYEGSFKWVSSDFTDCPAVPTSIPFDCSAVSVFTMASDETAGHTTLRSNMGYATAFHIHIISADITSPGSFTADPYASGQGPISIEQDGLRAEALKGTVTLSDGSTVKLRFSASAAAAATPYSGSATYSNSVCPSGTLTASWRGKYADATIKGLVSLNGTSMVPTSVANTPSVQTEQDHGTCNP